MKDRMFECFLWEDRLRFSDIERGVWVHSNKLSYHLGRLIEGRFLGKDGEEYVLVRG